MAGVRIERHRASGSLADGIGHHLRADAAFHADSTFVSGAAALRKDLDDAGVRTASARAIAHVGWELLLDGTLVGSAAEVCFWRAVQQADATRELVSATSRDRWVAFLGRWQEPRPSLRYDDPAWIADRVHAMLARRPRLAFPFDQAEDVAAVLSDHVGRVHAEAARVLATTASRSALA
jgi:hypothetical protein